jgi:hypothetical protein
MFVVGCVNNQLMRAYLGFIFPSSNTNDAFDSTSCTDKTHGHENPGIETNYNHSQNTQ